MRLQKKPRRIAELSGCVRLQPLMHSCFLPIAMAAKPLRDFQPAFSRLRGYREGMEFIDHQASARWQ